MPSADFPPPFRLKLLVLLSPAFSLSLLCLLSFLLFSSVGYKGFPWVAADAEAATLVEPDNKLEVCPLPLPLPLPLLLDLEKEARLGRSLPAPTITGWLCKLAAAAAAFVGIEDRADEEGGFEVKIDPCEDVSTLVVVCERE